MMEKKPKTRYHKILFNRDTPFGHKVQKDNKKLIPRKQKNVNYVTYPDGGDID